MSEARLQHCWEENAKEWTRLVRDGLLRSRVEVTNEAILAAVGEGAGKALLDLGCGEGWLSHRLSGMGWAVLGADASPALIGAARAGEGEFVVAGYENLKEVLAGRLFDAVVANFSLLGERSVEMAVATAAAHLAGGGRLLIQTLHPFAVRPYRDGWRDEDWRGMETSCQPAPWYFRTLESWSALLSRHGFHLWELREPRALGEEPSSLLLIAGLSPRKFPAESVQDVTIG